MTTQTVDVNEQLLVKPEVQEKTDNVMKVIADSNGGPSLERELNIIGEQSLKRATRTREMMQASVNQALPQLGNSSPMAKLINDAAVSTASINPNSVTNSKLLKLLPFKPVQRFLLRKYVERFQKTQVSVQSIFDNLEEGKEGLLEKMIQLENQYTALRETYADLEEDVAVSVSVQNKLDSMDRDSLPELDQRKLDTAQNKVARRLRDIETIKVAINQFFMSIDQTFEVQVQLNQGIDSIRQVGPIVLQNAIMIHAAISQQKEVAEAVQNVSATLGNAMRENAAMVKGNAETVAQIYNNPVIALQDLQAAYNDLEDAVAITRKARDESTVKAREMTEQLKAMNDAFEPISQDIDDKRAELNLSGDTGDDSNVIDVESKDVSSREKKEGDA